MRKKSHQSLAQEADELCAELREDDGIPPSVLAKRKQQEHRHVNYHGEQLCKQVRIALGEALACDCADPAFEDLRVIEVNMSSGTTALEVILAAPDQDATLLHDIEQRLQKAEGLLRASISNAINRKRLPRLKLLLVPVGR
ncbi:MAG: ribosome-binding factor A [Pseudoalteromonas tetraodonis]|jgi:ribosome-binding factor A